MSAKSAVEIVVTVFFTAWGKEQMFRLEPGQQPQDVIPDAATDTSVTVVINGLTVVDRMKSRTGANVVEVGVSFSPWVEIITDGTDEGTGPRPILVATVEAVANSASPDIAAFRFFEGPVITIVGSDERIKNVKPMIRVTSTGWTYIGGAIYAKGTDAADDARITGVIGADWQQAIETEGGQIFHFDPEADGYLTREQFTSHASASTLASVC